METISSKRRAFSTSKIITPFYRARKPSSAALQPYSSKPLKPTPSNSSPTSLEFVVNQPIKPKVPPSSPAAASPVGFIIVNQDQVFPPQTPKVTFVALKDNKRDSYGKRENFYGGAAEDEAVDDKATSYISSVQERFRLEDINL